jgi:hypothetical protein
LQINVLNCSICNERQGNRKLAKRGAKPKPAHLRLVDGTTNVTRHGTEGEQKIAVEQASRDFGALKRPAYLKGPALEAWKRWVVPASWLDASREASAIAFCELWQEFRHGPTSFPASKHGQMRAYMSELGLTDERNRVLDESKKSKDEFFDD